MQRRLCAPSLWGHLGVTTLLTALLMVMLCGSGIVQADSVPLATLGVLDLSDWDSNQQHTISLVGDWEFYWGQLLEPEDFAQANKPVMTGHFPVPGTWKQYQIGQAHLPTDGYATYRLVINMQPDQRVALKVPAMSSAYKLWVNGRLLAVNGQVGKSRTEEVPQYLPQTVDIPHSLSQTELIVQVSNYHHFRGGMRYPIIFGTKPWVHRLEMIELALMVFLIGCLLSMTIYHLLVFSLRRKDRTSYYFGIFCFFMLVRLFFVGPCIVFRMVPDYSWEIALKIEYITMYLMLPVFGSFLYSLYPREMHSWVLRVASYITYAFVAVVIVTPGRTFSMLLTAFQVLMLVGLAYCTYVFICAARHRREGAIILLCSFIVGGLTVINDLLLYREQLVTYDLSPWGVVAFMVAIAYLLSAKSAASFNEVEELSERLVRIDQMKDEFLANTSHELRTPLMGMIGLAESLLESKDTPPTQEQKVNLQLIVQSGQRLTRLVNNILYFEKLRQGNITLSREAVDVRQLVDVVFSLAQPLLDKPIQLVNEVPANLPHIQADVDRLEQILINLVSNAIKYTEQGTITVQAVQQKEDLCISVTDTGVGFSEQVLPYLFEPYVQSGTKDSQHDSSTGLGLGIVRTLVNLHGGQVHVESQVGQGATLWFTIPHQKAHAPSADSAVKAKSQKPKLAPSAVPNPGPQARGLSVDTLAGYAYPDQDLVSDQAPDTAVDIGTVRILLVDNEEVNLVVMKSSLTGFNATVDTASNGVAALDMIAKNEPYNMAVIDVMMPRMNGYELCRRIRQHHSLFALPIVIVTARNRTDEAAAAFAAGANDYLGKPFVRSEFVGRVRTILQLQKAVHQAMESTQQYAAERKQREWTEMMHNITVALSATLDTMQVWQRLLQVLFEMLSCQCAGAWTLSETGEAQEVALIKQDDMEPIVETEYAQLAETWYVQRAATLGIMREMQTGQATDSVFLTIPVKHQKETLGSILLLRPADLPFTQAEQETALAITIQAGLALDNARLYEQLKAKLFLLHQMYEISSTVVAASEFDDVLLQVALGAQRTLNLDRVAVFLLDRSDQRLHLRLGVEGQNVMPDRDTSYAIDSSLGGLINSNKPFSWLVEEPTSVPAGRVTAISDVPTPSAVLPLHTSKGAVGLLYVDTHVSGVVLTDNLLESLVLFATYAAMALERVVHERTVRVTEAQQALIMAQEQSRQQIAELLHGQVQTRLLVTWHRLGQVGQLLESDPQTAAAMLAEARTQLEDLRENEIRNTSHLLHPAIIKVGLLPAIRSLVRSIEDLVKVNILAAPCVEALDDPAMNKIPESIRLVVYRVLEEAINNAYRHGGAQHVQVTLDTQNDGLLIVIQDDGSGYDTKSSIPGLGFVNITARVDQVAGWWTIAGKPGVGTQVRLWLPVTHNFAAED